MPPRCSGLRRCLPCKGTSRCPDTQPSPIRHLSMRRAARHTTMTRPPALLPRMPQSCLAMHPPHPQPAKQPMRRSSMAIIARARRCKRISTSNTSVSTGKTSPTCNVTLTMIRRLGASLRMLPDIPMSASTGGSLEPCLRAIFPRRMIPMLATRPSARVTRKDAGARAGASTFRPFSEAAAAAPLLLARAEVSLATQLALHSTMAPPTLPPLA